MLGFAIPKTTVNEGTPPWRFSVSLVRNAALIWLLGCEMLLSVALNSGELEKGAELESIRIRAEARARQEWLACQAAGKRPGFPTPDAAESAWKLARACFELAEFSSTDADREQLANEGITACRRLLDSPSPNAAVRYYLALNLGQLARTRALGALRLVAEMEKHFQIVLAADPKLDRGGADRGLGQLYLEAPGWPVSIGNRGKARKHLVQSVEIDPGFPENHLCWMEALLKWKDHAALEKAVATYTTILPTARKEYGGKDWEWPWTDWDQRWTILRDGMSQRAARQK